MEVIVSVQLQPGETFELGADKAAAAVLKAVGGKKDKDLVTCHVQTLEMAEAGYTHEQREAERVAKMEAENAAERERLAAERAGEAPA